MASIARIKRHPKVEMVDDERSIGNSIIITLRKGWSFSPNEDNRVDGADDVRGAHALVVSAIKFNGPYTD